MAYEANIRQSYSSDIFHIHNLKKSEIRNTQHKRLFNSFDSFSCQPIESIPIKSHRINKSFQSTVFSQEPLKPERGRKYLGKNTLIIGTEDNSSYNIKRQPKSVYNPNLYYSQLSAYERRMKQLNGNMKDRKEINTERNDTRKYKTSFGVLDSEIRLTDNGEHLPIGTSKDRKLYMIYHTNGNKMSWSEFREQFKRNKLIRNTRINYNKEEGKEYPANRIENLKSNILFTSERDTLNKNFNYTKIQKESEFHPYTESCNKCNKSNHNKMNFRERDNEFFYTKVSWKDENIDLYYRNTSTGHEDLTAHERKMTEFYGDKNLTKPIKQTDSKMRESLKKSYHYNHPFDNDAQIRKKFEQISTMSYNNISNFKRIKVRKAENLTKNYEIDNYKHIKDVDIDNIDKEFKRQGMHVYDKRIDESYSDGKKKGRVSFSIREGNNKEEFMARFNTAIKKIKRETGLDITPSVSPSPSIRPKPDHLPSTLSWEDNHYNDYIKGRNIQTTLNEKIHLKAGFKSEKISVHVINHKYKKR